MNDQKKKILIREGGVSKRPGWPFLFEMGLHVEGLFDEFVSDDDKQISSFRELSAFKKRTLPKILRAGEFSSTLVDNLEYQILHHVIYTEYVINFTNFSEDLKFLDDTLMSAYYLLMEKSQRMGGYFSIVPELETSVEEKIFIDCLELCVDLKHRNIIKGILLLRRGDASISTYSNKINDSGLSLILDFSTKIDKNRFFEEIGLSGVRRIHYNARIEGFLKEMRKKNISIQISPTSDVSFFSNFSFADYPFVEYFRKGNKTVVSGGYPKLTDTSTESEFVLLKSSFGLSVEDILTISKYSANYAFCDEAARESLLQKIESVNP
ncbi:hypothetical protein JXA84_03085 [candidate division WOR-3 bacterium]|nr:hypothetical protein [candidate division WOR-3 bacterium]